MAAYAAEGLSPFMRISVITVYSSQYRYKLTNWRSYHKSETPPFNWNGIKPTSRETRIGLWSHSHKRIILGWKPPCLWGVAGAWAHRRGFSAPRSDSRLILLRCLTWCSWPRRLWKKGNVSWWYAIKRCENITQITW